MVVFLWKINHFICFRIVQCAARFEHFLEYTSSLIAIQGFAFCQPKVKSMFSCICAQLRQWSSERARCILIYICRPHRIALEFCIARLRAIGEASRSCSLALRWAHWAGALTDIYMQRFSKFAIDLMRRISRLCVWLLFHMGGDEHSKKNQEPTR